MNSELKLTSQIEHNKIAHDLIASSYDETHVEIYNPTEQKRIEEVLKSGISLITTRPGGTNLALDFGAGTGNLTGHLLKLGMNVLAADVSPKSLAILEEKCRQTGQLQTVLLNGVDLSNMEDNTFDMITTYSVLHHVPDYLSIIKEFVRVLKPGGIIYIDHENAPSVWLEEVSDEYETYKRELETKTKEQTSARLFRKFKLLFSVRAWRRLLKRKLHGLNEEGDIHVFKADHIEWNKIDEILIKECEQLRQEDYLVCRELSLEGSIYEKYKMKCVDMRVALWRKVS